MKKLAAILVAAGFLTFPASTHAGPKQFPKQFFKAYGHQLKLSFTDVRRHPFAWGIYFGGTLAANYMDTASTCYGLGHGTLVESNPLFGHRPSCSTLVLSTSALTFGVQLPAVHTLSDAWTTHCYNEAADPGSKWNQLAAKGYGSKNPESCRWNVPAAAMSEWPWHAVIIHDNLQLIEQQR